MAEETKLTIEQRYGTKYSGILARQLQQEHSILTPWVTVMPNCEGKSVQIDYSSKSEMKRITSAYQDVESPIRDTFTARQMFACPFYTAHQFTCDANTYSNRLKHGVPNIMTEIKAEAQRKKDEQILGVYLDSESGLYRKAITTAQPTGPYDEMVTGGILGTNYLGVNGQFHENLGADNIIDVDFVESGSAIESNMTLGKLRYAAHLLRKSRAYIPGVTTPVCALSSNQYMALMQQLEVSHPGWGIMSMKEGRLSKIYGIEIVLTELLPYADGTTDVRLCPVWIKEHVYFGAWKDVSVQVDGPGNGRVNYGQVVAQMSFGSTRKYLQSALEIQCIEHIGAVS